MASWWLPVLALTLAAGHCLAADPATTETSVLSEIYVVSHGWHAGVVIRRADIPADRWPEKRDFPDADFLEVGWGDRDYYQSRDPDLGTALKAGLWPTDSVLHVVGLHGPVAANFPHSEIIVLPVSRAGLAQLMAFIDAAHDRPDHTALAPLGPGLYGHSYFYPARGRFHLFNNCNRWTARALRAAGFNIEDSVGVDGLLSQLQPDTTASGKLRTGSGE